MCVCECVCCVHVSVLLLFVYLCVHDIIFVFEGYLSQCVYFEACSNLVPADAVLKTELKTILLQKNSNFISPVGTFTILQDKTLVQTGLCGIFSSILAFKYIKLATHD